MKRNGSKNGRLQELEREMNARFDSMDREMVALKDGLNDLNNRFGKAQKQFQKDIRGLKKTTRGLFEYVEHLDGEFQDHRHDPVMHFKPAS